MSEYQLIYEFKDSNEPKILGINNLNIKTIQEVFAIELLAKHNQIFLENKYLSVKDMLVSLFETMELSIDNNFNLKRNDIIYLIDCIKKSNLDEYINILHDKTVIYTTSNGKSIYPRTINQRRYIRILDTNDIVFSIGPAGSGKTYLAVMYALSTLKNDKMRKIILVRPVVEAGERLGFLPGDLKEKIDPYLIPLYDALYEALGKEHVERLIEKGVIEVAPLAYMRGRTLENAIIILDEAQNATKQQMKMFLTRLGLNSKMIITGDITQIDLANFNMSGLLEARTILKDIDGIAFIEFNKYDVMRHHLIHKIITRYDGVNYDDRDI